MINAHEVFPVSLEHALLANRVVGALSGERRDVDLEERRRALVDAGGFFDVILKGRRFTQSREVCAESYHAAVAYGDAIKAVELLPATQNGQSELGELLNALASTVIDLQAGKRVQPGKVDELVGFFERVRDVCLCASNRPLEKLKFQA
jgi:hypothetical protein